MAEISSTAHPLAGFVLAGGQSRRMGRDKASLPWQQHSLLEHMVQLLSTVARPVRIVGKDELPDIIPNQGPLGGILTALEVTSTRKNLIVAVDLPLLTIPFLRMFRERFIRSDRHLLACKIRSDYPLCLGLDRALLPVVKDRIAHQRRALNELVAETEAEILQEEEIKAAGFSDSLFFNLNSPADWDRLNSPG